LIKKYNRCNVFDSSHGKEEMERILTKEQEHIVEYLKTRKTPVTAEQLAKKLIINPRRAANTLKLLYLGGLIDCKLQGKLKLYFEKR
jgi:Mn-dependent DtxR family transcriptional regulator